MNHPPDPNPDDPGDLSYEDFEDVTWKDSGDLEPIDLDALDDEIEPVVEDEATEELLEVIDTLDDEIPPVGKEAPAGTKPASLPKQAEPPSRARPEASAGTPDRKIREEAGPVVEPAAIQEATVEVVTPAQEVEATQAPAGEKATAEVAAPAAGEKTGEAAAETPPAPPPPTYQVLLALPPDLGAQVLELRTTGEIVDAPPPGIALTAGFKATDLSAVEAALTEWVRVHLPLQLETTGILAEVAGAQQYIAAWTLEPEDELREAQLELMRSLAPLITLLPDTPAAFRVRVTISDHVPARRFPHVIAQMQRDFETYVWHATELMLVQHSPDAAPGDWEIARTFD